MLIAVRHLMEDDKTRKSFLSAFLPTVKINYSRMIENEELQSEQALKIYGRSENGRYVIVEMQSVQDREWERSALLRASTEYALQSNPSALLMDVARVVSLNFVPAALWTMPRNHYHYRLHDDIQIFAYSLGSDKNNNMDKEEVPKERKEWLMLMSEADQMTEGDMEGTISSPAVKRAFQRLRIENMPPSLQEVMKKR